MPAVTGIRRAKPFGSTISQTTLNPWELAASLAAVPVLVPNHPAEFFGNLPAVRHEATA
jgi:hypothetical protein